MRAPTELTLEMLLADPLTRLVMRSDNVSVAETARAFEDAREALARLPGFPAGAGPGRPHIAGMAIVRQVADFPRPPALETVPERLLVTLGGQTIAETAPGEGWRVLETRHPPTYYLPMRAFRPGALRPASRTSFCEWKGVAHYLGVCVGGRLQPDAAWTYPDPSPAYAALKDHVAVYPGRMDACFVGDEQATPQPGGFYGGWITAAFEGPFKGAPGTQFW